MRVDITIQRILPGQYFLTAIGTDPQNHFGKFAVETVMIQRDSRLPEGWKWGFRYRTEPDRRHCFRTLKSARAYLEEGTGRHVLEALLNRSIREGI